jgi:hypothetical protein
MCQNVTASEKQTHNVTTFDTVRRGQFVSACITGTGGFRSLAFGLIFGMLASFTADCGSEIPCTTEVR